MIVYAVNNYVWALLQKKCGWSTVTSKNLIPMFPAQQVPEAMNTEEPFVIYSSSNDFNGGELEPEDAEIISYVIYAGGVDRENDVDKAVTTLKNAFKAFNSAENINTWIQNPNNVIAAQDREDLITYTQVMNTESSGESSIEGGKVDGYVQIRVGYLTNPDDYSI